VRLRRASRVFAGSVNRTAERASNDYRRWFGCQTVVVAWMVLIGSAFHPPHGSGVPICFTAATTGVPCPGCGLSRSLSCSVRGMLAEAWDYHPFGPVFLVVFAAIAFVSILPPAAHGRLAAWVSRHPHPSRAVYVVLVAAFVGHGVVRALLHIAHWPPAFALYPG